MITELFARGWGWVRNWCRRRRRDRRRAGRRGRPAGPLRFEGLEGRWTPTALPAGFTAAMVVSGIGGSTAIANAAGATLVMGAPWLYDEVRGLLEEPHTPP